MKIEKDRGHFTAEKGRLHHISSLIRKKKKKKKKNKKTKKKKKKKKKKRKKKKSQAWNRRAMACDRSDSSDHSP